MERIAFQGKRFLMEAHKYWAENERTLLLRLATYFGVMVLIFCLWGLHEANNRAFEIESYEYTQLHSTATNASRTDYSNYRMTYYETCRKTHDVAPLKDELFFAVFIIFTFGAYIGSTMLEHTDSKASRIAFYAHPTSNMEKYLTRWIMVVPCFMIASAILFAGADLVRVGVTHLFYPSDPIAYPVNYSMLFRLINSSNAPLYALLFSAFLSIQSLFMLGSTIYRKNAFIKTFVLGGVFLALFITLSVWAYNLVRNGQQDTAAGMYLNGTTEGDVHNAWTFVSLMLGLTVFNWIVAYVRMKENDVIQRLFT